MTAAHVDVSTLDALSVQADGLENRDPLAELALRRVVLSLADVLGDPARQIRSRLSLARALLRAGQVGDVAAHLRAALALPGPAALLDQARRALAALSGLATAVPSPGAEHLPRLGVFRAALVLSEGAAFSVLHLQLVGLPASAGTERSRWISQLRRQLRAGDLMAQVGPDEYAVLLVGVGQIVAVQIAERLLTAGPDAGLAPWRVWVADSARTTDRSKVPE